MLPLASPNCLSLMISGPHRGCELLSFKNAHQYQVEVGMTTVQYLLQQQSSRYGLRLTVVPVQNIAMNCCLLRTCMVTSYDMTFKICSLLSISLFLFFIIFSLNSESINYNTTQTYSQSALLTCSQSAQSIHQNAFISFLCIPISSYPTHILQYYYKGGIIRPIINLQHQFYRQPEINHFYFLLLIIVVILEPL